MKKLFTRWIAGTMTGVLGLLFTAAPVKAGDQEWAVAGQILTGLAVFNVLHQLAQPPQYYYESPPTVYVDRPVYIEQPVYYPQPGYPAPTAVTPPPVPAQEQPMYAPTVYTPTRYAPTPYEPAPIITYETRYYEGRRMEGCPRIYYRDPSFAPREIMMPYGPGRRLYQPGIRGHAAYIQQWAPNQGVWVTVGTHPCLWR